MPYPMESEPWDVTERRVGQLSGGAEGKGQRRGEKGGGAHGAEGHRIFEAERHCQDELRDDDGGTRPLLLSGKEGGGQESKSIRWTTTGICPPVPIRVPYSPGVQTIPLMSVWLFCNPMAALGMHPESKQWENANGLGNENAASMFFHPHQSLPTVVMPQFQAGTEEMPK